MPVLKKAQTSTGPSLAPGRSFPDPFWTGPGALLYLGDVRTQLRRLPARSVHCVVTSPPYYALRDYGTGTWEGGSAECDHVERYASSSEKSSTLNGKFTTVNKTNAAFEATARHIAVQCGKCGARRIDAQIGLEEKPDCLGWATGAPCKTCFVCHMVEVFAEVRRVLRDDGSLWLNLGDSYAATTKNNRNGLSSSGLNHGKGGSNYEAAVNRTPTVPLPEGVKSKDLLGIPWRVALALQANGWVLRQDIIWHAPDKMPESVQNRCTKSHEHIFLLVKGSDYYFDGVAIQDNSVDKESHIGRKKRNPDHFVGQPKSETRSGFSNIAEGTTYPTKNKRDVWIVPTAGYAGAHFATFNPELIKPCILAGTSEYGCCADCGTPYERVTAKSYSPRKDGGGYLGRKNPPNGWQEADGKLGHYREEMQNVTKETVAWRKPCGCKTDEVAPCVVLDPFIGSGTTVALAVQLGRYGVGIDLSEEYLKDHAILRIEAAARGERLNRAPVNVVPQDVPPPPEPW